MVVKHFESLGVSADQKIELLRPAVGGRHLPSTDEILRRASDSSALKLKHTLSKVKIYFVCKVATQLLAHKHPEQIDGSTNLFPASPLSSKFSHFTSQCDAGQLSRPSSLFFFVVIEFKLGAKFSDVPSRHVAV